MTREKDQKDAPIVAMVARFLLRLVGALPPRAGLFVGHHLGRVLWRLDGKTKAVVTRNIDACYPQLNASEKKQRARAAFINGFISLFEIAHFWVGSVEKYKKIRIDDSDKALLDAVIGENKGILLACPHLGHWELVNYFLSRHYHLMALYRPPRIRQLDQFMTRSRERFGGELIPASARGVKYLYKNLNTDRVLAILPDQEPGPSGGLFAPFFGISTWSMTLVSRLLQKTGAPMLYCFAERLGPLDYKIHVLKPDEGVYDKDLQTAVAAMNAGVERCIALCPEQYQWTYKRFKSRPESEKAAPPFYD